MSEKTSLLQSIPPVQKSSSGEYNARSPSRGGGTQPANDPSSKENSALLERQSATGEAVTRSATDGGATQTVASVATPGDSQTISIFQYATYASFVLNFILAGFAAVILFRKVSKLADKRFSASVKALAGGFVIVVFHGFFATYLYASYLNDPSRSVPLFMTMALWVLLGPFVGYTTRNLLARKESPNRTAALFDGGFYAFVFALSAFGISSSVTANGALLLTIIACFLVVAPVARSLTAYKVASARHRELKEVSSKILLYVLLFLPALIPVLAVMHVFGMSDLLTLFLVNFITIDFVIIASSSFLITSSNFEQEPEPTEAGVASSEPKQGVKQAPAAPSQPQTPQREKRKIVTGNPDDPIIQFLNSEDSESGPDDTANEKKPKNAPRIQPPGKPASPGLSPSKKRTSDSDKPAPNAPQRMKAPAKPKKRK